MSARTPQELLGVLEADLLDAFAAEQGRSARRVAPRGSRRSLALLAAVIVAGASTAAATRTLFSASPPVPRLAPQSADLLSGVTAGTAWRLELARCVAPAGGASLLLDTSTGGAGGPCAPRYAPTEVLYGSLHGAALAFGLVPPGTSRVVLGLDQGSLEAHPNAIAPAPAGAAMLPTGVGAYVVALPAERTVTSMTAFDSGGRLVLGCSQERCAEP